MEMTSFTKPKSINLDINKDILDHFDCGVPALNQWLQNRSLSNEIRGASRTYVSFAEDKRLAGYFCLSNAVISYQRLLASQRRKMPEPVPCCLLGWLAVDQYVKGKGLGAALLVESIKITKELAKLSRYWSLIVQPKGEEEAHFFSAFWVSYMQKIRRRASFVIF